MNRIWIRSLLAVSTFVAIGPLAQGGEKEPTKEKTAVAQVIQLSATKVTVMSDGEVWTGGNKVGQIMSDGEIWVGGTKEGELTSDGEVWKAGDKVGDVTSDGDVWRDGNDVGDVSADGTIWIEGSREGTFKGGKPAHAAVIVFYGFFDLGE